MASQDWFDKDFYKVLGVDKTASDAELKKTYRKLARQYHPDSNPGDAAAENRFKEISEAYSVLSDKEQRQEYDQVRAMGSGARFTAGGPGQGGGFEDVFGGMFGQGGGGQRVRFGQGGAGGFEDILGGMFGAGTAAAVAVASASPAAATGASVGRRRVATSRRRRPSTSPPRSRATPSSSRRATAVR